MCDNKIKLRLDVSAATLRCSRLNEEYKCGSACQTTCSNLGKPCPIINIVSA